MKKTQFKDALRNIWKQRVSFLSIVVIALLGVTTFLGIGYSSAALQKNASTAYNRSNFRDIEVISTRLLTPEDLDCMRAIEGVSDVEPVWQTAGNAYVNEEKAVVNVITKTERINLTEVTEGRLPENGTECAIERSLSDSMGWKIGDVIEWVEMTDVTGQYFLGGEPLTIVGIAEHPDHASRNVPETPYLIVTRELFDMDSLSGCCMKAEVVIDKLSDVNRFGAAYTKDVSEASEALLKLAEERIPIRDAQIKERTLEQLDNADEAINEARQSYEDERRDLETRKELLALSEQAVSALEEQLSGLSEDSESYAQIAQALEAAKTELNEQRQQTDEKSEELESKNESIAFMTDYVAEQRDKTENMEPGSWYCFDGHGNASFVQLIIGSGNLKSLEMTFSLLFVLVGALVIYATISKMIDEQRTLVGTTKALGFFNREIFAKYLLFGLSATLIGMVLGILTAHFWMEGFILKGYDVYYTFDTTKVTLEILPTLIVLSAGTLLAVGAITFACFRLLRTPAVQLMQQSVPAGKNAPARNGKRLLSLYSRLILLNIRTDLRRVIVTVVSVAGCCALVVIGFTLKAAVDGAVKSHYETVVQYDGKLKTEWVDEAEPVLQEAGAAYVPMYNLYVTYRITDNQVGELLCGDITAIESMYRLNDRNTGEPLAPTDDGILIQRRLAEIYDLKVGSEFEIAVGGVNVATVKVAGVFENYIGRPMVMSSAYYAALFGSEPLPNACLIRLNGADEEALVKNLKQAAGFISYTPVSEDRVMFDAATSVINAIVILFIFMAAVMAGVVLTNLTNIYIMQKKRELTIMRINGFTVKEAIGYCTRETVLTTLTGIVLGIALGTGIAYRIVRSMEQAFIRFDRSVSFTAWLFGALITALFAIIINVIVLRKVKNLKLTDIA